VRVDTQRNSCSLLGGMAVQVVRVVPEETESASQTGTRGRGRGDGCWRWRCWGGEHLAEPVRRSQGNRLAPVGREYGERCAFDWSRRCGETVSGSLRARGWGRWLADHTP
jgi:hypothetical protein